jgi:hypothetical protein
MKNNEIIQTINISDGIVSGKNIPTYANIWQMIAVNPDGKVVQRGTWNDDVSFFIRNGKEILRRVQHVQYTDKLVIQKEEVFRDNLMHVWLTIHDEGKEPHTDIKYEGNRIWGKKVFRVDGLDSIEQISLPFSYELPHSIFDWHLWGILVSGFPLKEGYTARFLAHESYSYLPGDFRWFAIKVTGQEVIECGKWGKVDCWLVQVIAEVEWKIWIAKQKDVAPVQQICIYNTDGVQFWWKPMMKF